VDFDSRLGLEFDSLHPNDAAVDYEDWPSGPDAARNFHALKNFLHFAGPAWMAYPDAVSWSPRAQDGFFIGGDRSCRIGGCAYAEMDTEGGSFHFAGDVERVFRCNFRTVGIRGTEGVPDEAQLAVRALSAQALRELELLPGAAVKGQRAKSFGCGEVEAGSGKSGASKAGASLLGGVTEEAALDCGREFG
jgi:hypothetical protein